MRPITPNYVNELAEIIGAAVGAAFPKSIFTVTGMIGDSPRRAVDGSGGQAIHFKITALLSKEQMPLDPHMVQQISPGRISRHLTLEIQDPGPTAILQQKLPLLIAALNGTILSPLL